MRPIHTLAAGLAAALIAAPALAGPKLYAVENTENYCPAGLQPVTMNGVICCGTPNQPQTYQQVKHHPATKHRTHRVTRAARTCAEGEKGCY